MRFYVAVTIPGIFFVGATSVARMHPSGGEEILPTKGKGFEDQKGFFGFLDLPTAQSFAEWGTGAVLEVEAEEADLNVGVHQLRGGPRTCGFARKGRMVALHSSPIGAESHLIAPIATLYGLRFFPHPALLVGVRLS